MSFLIGGVTYRTVKIGRGRRLHLVHPVLAWTSYCGLVGEQVEVEHGGEHDLLCNTCDTFAKAARERQAS